MPNYTKMLLAPITGLVAPLAAFAAETPEEAPAQNPDGGKNLIEFAADARVDWQHVGTDGKTDNSATGFEGKYLMLTLDGQIAPGVTYSWRQRMNRQTFSNEFFDATDWIQVSYNVRRVTLSAGKQVVVIGGYEYDRNPIDLYGTSVFWNNVPCYRFGASGTWHINPANNLTAQVVQSPWADATNRNMYGYNLQWQGQFGAFSTSSSLNLLEYAPNKYINYIALGGKLNVDRVTMELDLVNRAAAHQTFFFKDASVIGEVAWRPNRQWRLHGKVSYDVNRTKSNADYTVLPGTELTMAGGGVEFMPLIRKNTSLRLHATCYHAWGRNANSADLMQRGTTYASAGVRWHMDIYKMNRKK